VTTPVHHRVISGSPSARITVHHHDISQLKALLHSSPREAGKARSIWTLALVAEVCFENKLTESLVSDETIRTTLKRMGVNWQRARAWISSPDPAYARKKRRVTG
jgi:hypothetical protein